MEADLSGVLKLLLRIGASVHLNANGGLRVEAPRGAIDAHLRTALLEQRDAIVDYLRRQSLPARVDSVTVTCIETGRRADHAFFCFHGFQGTIGMYRPLAAQLAGCGDVFGVQAVGVDLTRQALHSVSEMADYYADQLLQIKRRHVLVGWCVGAAMALETARRLRSKGAPVDFVVCADPWLGHIPSDLERWRDFLEVYLGDRSSVVGVAESGRLDRSGRIQWLAQQRCLARPHLVVEEEAAIITRRLSFWEAMNSALRQYRLQPHGETIELFVSREYSNHQGASLRERWGSASPRLIKDSFPIASAFDELGKKVVELLG